MNGAVITSIERLHSTMSASCDKPKPRRPRMAEVVAGEPITKETLTSPNIEWVCKNCKGKWEPVSDSRWIVCDYCYTAFHLECSTLKYKQKDYYTLDIEKTEFKCCKGKRKAKKN